MQPILDPIWEEHLSPREYQCCELLLQGMSLPEMADSLGLALRTVKGVFNRLYRRFGIREGVPRIHLVRRLLCVEGEYACSTTSLTTSASAESSACMQLS
jgi:DNA-binding NarL/FixJ family response regulator